MCPKQLEAGKVGKCDLDFQRRKYATPLFPAPGGVVCRVMKGTTTAVRMVCVVWDLFSHYVQYNLCIGDEEWGGGGWCAPRVFYLLFPIPFIVFALHTIQYVLLQLPPFRNSDLLPPYLRCEPSLSCLSREELSMYICALFALLTRAERH